MKKMILIVVMGMVMVGCTSRTDAERALNAEGYTNIRMTGYNFFSCSQDDLYHTGFEAINPRGRKIKGTVCSGIFKNATIRY